MKKISNTEIVNVVVTNEVRNNTLESKGVSYAAMNKAGREILKKTRTINQAVKTFGGLMNSQIKIGKESHTVKEWLTMCGVAIDERKGLTVAALMKAWPYTYTETVDGKEYLRCQVYRNVPAAFKVSDHKELPVFAYDTENNEWLKVSIWRKTTIAVDAWSCDIILTGLLQGQYPEKMEQMFTNSMTAFDALEHVYCFEKVANKGGVNNAAKEVRKDSVLL